MSIETYSGNGHSNGSALAPYQHPGALAPQRTLGRLVEWAQAAQAAHQVAESLVKTSFVPMQFRDKPHEATAAILAGDEVGLSPMASLNAFSIIQGAAAPKAMTQRAVVQSKGHAIWQVEATDTRAIFRGRRHGETETHESEWTIERARNLGLINRNPEWKKQPKAMLIARATAEVCRLTAADAILGIPYSAEELTDGAGPDWQPLEAANQEATAAPTPAPRTIQRRSKPRTAPARQATPASPAPPARQEDEPQGPPLPGEEGYAEPGEQQPAVELATKDQLTKLHTVFTKGGVTKRETCLEACSLMVGRDLTSSAQLTKAEASRLIDELEDLARHEAGLAEMVAEIIGRNSEEESGGDQT